MKILIISSYLPYPLFSGGHIRLFNLIKRVSQKHEVVLICEKRDYQDEKDINEIRKICKNVITVRRRKQWTIPNILKTFFSPYPFLLIGHKNIELEIETEKILEKEKFDLIHIETFYVMHNLPKTSLPIVLAEHNIEYLVYKRFARESNILLRPYFYLDVLKIKYWEKKFWGKVTKLIAVSKEEKELMELNAEIIPNGVDLNKYQISNIKYQISNKKSEKRILFIGDFKWIQNRNSVEWILKEIWLEISSKFKVKSSKLNLKLWIVGREIPESIKSLTTDRNVIFDENAPRETSKIYENADLLLAPIRVGGGTSYKILEAMASGVPVVTTTLGIEGIEAQNNEHVLIEDKVDNIANKVLELLENNDLYAKIAKNARKLIEEKYDWEIIAKKLEEVYQSAVK